MRVTLRFITEACNHNTHSGEFEVKEGWQGPMHGTIVIKTRNPDIRDEQTETLMMNKTM